MRVAWLALALLSQLCARSNAQVTETSVVVLPASTVTVVTTSTMAVNSDQTLTVTPTTPTPAQYTDTTLFRDAILNSTNFYRWEHNASFLAWNDSLASYAVNYAAECIWAHSHGDPGENLARGYVEISAAVDAWGNERSMYEFGRPPTGFTEATGHFTQLVWKSTQTLGCAVTNCDGKNGVEGWFLVCEYWPPGNIVGQGQDTDAWFEVNVQSQVNVGQGFDIAEATAGASGVGTRLASPGLPVPTTLTESSADQSLRSTTATTTMWKTWFVGALALLFHADAL